MPTTDTDARWLTKKRVKPFVANLSYVVLVLVLMLTNYTSNQRARKWRTFAVNVAQQCRPSMPHNYVKAISYELR